MKHSVIIFSVYLGIIIYFPGLFQANAQFPDAPQPWQQAYNFSLEGFEFQHPMTVLNSTDIEFIRNRIHYNVEPQNIAYSYLIMEAQLALTFTPNPPATLNIPGGYVDAAGLEYARVLLWDNCNAAYTNALAYTFTDSIHYANKAIEILMSWANKGTTFTGQDRGLQLGSYFTPMLYAADLLYNYTGWANDDMELFKIWWRTQVVQNGSVLSVMRSKDNNWKEAGLLGIFAAAVVLEDTDYLHEALIQLKSYFFARTDKNVSSKGISWKFANDAKGVYFPREVDRNEGRSGLTYTAYSLTTLVQAFEIARYAGYDFWNDVTIHGVGMKDVITQYFKWDIKNETFPWYSLPSKTDKRRNHYEIANTRFSMNEEVSAFIKMNRPLLGREGDTYTTLNKGDMGGWDTTLILRPAIILVEPLSSTQIKIHWNDNAANEYGFYIERKENDVFEIVDTLKFNTTVFTDTGLQPNTSYTYRIGSFNLSENIFYSDEESGTTQYFPLDHPDAPDSLKTSMASATSIRLAWIDNSENEDGFIIERKTRNGEFLNVAKAGVNDTVYIDTDISLNVFYTYRLYAFNQLGNSGFSNEVSDSLYLVSGIYKEINGLLSMEAEHGDVGERWHKKTDEVNASGGKFIEMNTDYHHTADSPSCSLPECLSTYYFEISNEGDYAFWFRLLSATGEHDSFFWRINAGNWIRENGRYEAGWYMTQNNETKNLKKGIHILEIAYRERGTQLDKFVLQKAGNPEPVNEGPSESISYGAWLPRFPSNLTLQVNTSYEVQIGWDINSDNERGFIIERSEKDGFIKIGEATKGATYFIDESITPNTNYKYRIKAFNEYGNSNYSDELSVLTKSNTSINNKPFTNNFLVSISPNPFKQNTTLTIILEKPSQVKVQLLDLLGRNAIVSNAYSLQSGENSLLIDRGVLQSGIYFLKVNSMNSQSVIRLIAD